MKPYYADEWLTLYGGDCREVLASLPTDSVDCVVTSPPYWGLRDYGADGQLGLERTPEEYVANMVAVFRAVRRVLKPSGTCWLNLGDSYATGAGKVGDRPGGGAQGDAWNGHRGSRGGSTKQPQTGSAIGPLIQPNRLPLPGLKPKDLVGIPWRVAFALQADGWYLRSDIIWAKPNPMPESVTDRPTKSHEYLFLLTKSARYYFDADAVAEASTYGPESGQKEAAKGTFGGKWAEPSDGMRNDGAFRAIRPTRNIRSVWSIATRPYPGAHFAVFPPELPERCIKAGSSERGVCPECGAPWERVVSVVRAVRDDTTRDEDKRDARRTAPPPPPEKGWESERTTTGWEPTCSHESEPQPSVVLDPFGGSGTVGMVANRLSRRAILIDLNPEYLKQQMTRNAQTPLGLTEGDAA